MDSAFSPKSFCQNECAFSAVAPSAFSTPEVTIRSGAMGSRIAMLNIIDILYTALSNLTFDASLDQLSRTYIQKPNVEDGVGKG